MLAILFSVLEPVQQPEYTGENRCLPCTVVNVGIAAVVAGTVATLSLVAGVIAFAVSVLLIYLRGYLVPGTPTLTKRYLPDRIHRLFGAHHGRETAVERGPETETEVGTLLREAGVVTDCPATDDLCLEPAFRDAWRERICEIRENDDGRERLAAILDVDSAELTFEEQHDRYWVLYEGDRIDAWPSEAAFLADLAVDPTLAEWYDEWADRSDRERTLTIASLRAFLERCPACGSDLEAAESTWESCCREGTTASVECPECESVVFSGNY